MNFETYIEVRAADLPAEYLRLLSERHDETFERDSIVKDVMVRVEYDAGSYWPGDPERAIPPECEDPEIHVLTLLEDDWEMEWKTPNLPSDTWGVLHRACWDEQERDPD